MPPDNPRLDSSLPQWPRNPVGNSYIAELTAPAHQPAAPFSVVPQPQRVVAESYCLFRGSVLTINTFYTECSWSRSLAQTLTYTEGSQPNYNHRVNTNAVTGKEAKVALFMVYSIFPSEKTITTKNPMLSVTAGETKKSWEVPAFFSI